MMTGLPIRSRIIHKALADFKIGWIFPAEAGTMHGFNYFKSRQDKATTSARETHHERNRTKIGIPKDRLFKLNDDLGWHPSMRALNEHWDEGNVAVVQGVGYPNPNRSHFESSTIWYTGEPDESKQFGLGWIGRGLINLAYREPRAG